MVAELPQWMRPLKQIFLAFRSNYKASAQLHTLQLKYQTSTGSITNRIIIQCSAFIMPNGRQWRIRRGARGARSPLYFQTKMRSKGPKKNFLSDQAHLISVSGRPPAHLSQGIDHSSSPPPYLKVWLDPPLQLQVNDHPKVYQFCNDLLEPRIFFGDLYVEISLSVLICAEHWTLKLSQLWLVNIMCVFVLQEFVSLSKELLNTPSLHTRLINNAKTYVSEHHSIENERNTYEWLVEKLASLEHGKRTISLENSDER